MPTKVHVGNLSWNITNDDLRNVFSSCGCILDLIVIRNSETGVSRGFGYVTFSSDREAQNAIANLDERELDGRPIKVSWARPRDGGGGKRYGRPIVVDLATGVAGSRGRGYDSHSGDYGIGKGGYGRQGFQQYGYGSGRHGSQGGYYRYGGYRDGGYF